MSRDGVVHDVVIAGGGLAGLSLARQLRMRSPDLDILTLDPHRRPLPEAAFKVGESTVEIGTYYFTEILGLREYLEREHLGKLGLRFFYPSGNGRFAGRPELGVGDWLPASAYQLDRGRIENHLRELVLGAGVDLREGVVVEDIRLQDGGSHAVDYRPVDGGSVSTARGRWVVDATGRRRLLQRKLGLEKRREGRFSAAWFRLRGELDVDTFVPESALAWHRRVKPRRWYSTNHLMGPGYWVWIIPLASGHTSVGIVATEELVSFSRFNTYERALEFLGEREPVLVEHLRDHDAIDFRTMRDYSYSAHRVFSAGRWACIGDAGVFVDPYYSVGLNMIAFANGLVTRMIELDGGDERLDEFADHANGYFLSLTENLAHHIQRAYPFYHRPRIMVLKTVWDFCVGWCIADPQLYHETYLDPRKSAVMSGMVARAVRIQGRLMKLFEDWAAITDPSDDPGFDYIDYIADLPTLAGLYRRNLPRAKTFHEILADLRFSLDTLEELALVVFLLAVEDARPESLPGLQERGRLEATAIGLDPSAWQDDGLFRPLSAPRDLTPLHAEIREIFRPRHAPQRV